MSFVIHDPDFAAVYTALQKSQAEIEKAKRLIERADAFAQSVRKFQKWDVEAFHREMLNQ